VEFDPTVLPFGRAFALFLTSAAVASGDPDSLGVLTGIRDSLKRIVGLLKKGGN
jgi:hypothetical protein